MDVLDPPPPPARPRLPASLPLGCTFGVPVSLHWSMALLPPGLFGLFTRWFEFGPGASLAWAGVWSVVWMIVVWSHEIAHVWAARTAGAPPASITIRPLGCMSHPDLRLPSARVERLVAIAGPLSHAVWFVLAGVPYFFLLHDRAGGRVADMLSAFLGLQAGLLFVNVLPFWPMDGGRLVRAWLATRIHPVHASSLVSYTGFAGAAVLGIAAIAIFLQADSESVVTTLGVPAMLVLSAGGFLTSRGLLLEARWGEGPYAMPPAAARARPVSAKWAGEEPTPPEPVVVEERRAGAEAPRRAAEQPQRPRAASRAAARPLQERIDELLDRIIEVGSIENLSDAERRELSDASERLKRGEK